MTTTTSPMTKFEGNVKFILMMLAFLLLAALLQIQQHQQDVVSARQVVVQKTLCTNQNITAGYHNALIDELVSSVRSSDFTLKEKTDRIDRYNAARVDMIVCLR